MAIREILKYPDPFLKTKAKPVEEVDDDLRVTYRRYVRYYVCG